ISEKRRGAFVVESQFHQGHGLRCKERDPDLAVLGTAEESEPSCPFAKGIGSPAMFDRDHGVARQRQTLDRIDQIVVTIVIERRINLNNVVYIFSQIRLRRYYISLQRF